MHDDVEALFQRTLHARAGEGIVGDGDDAALAADLADCGQVGQFQHRIGRGFDPNHFRVGLQGGEQVIVEGLQGLRPDAPVAPAPVAVTIPGG